MPKTIYVLKNEFMPGLVKIGLTADSVESRISSLSAATGVPLPFECHYAAEIPEHVSLEKIEKTLHLLFSEHRVNPKREFFKVEPEKVVLALAIGSFKEITPGKSIIDPVEQQALDKAKATRPNINLGAIGIAPGAELTLSRDENYKATVVDGNKVSYKGEVMSLSAAALAALKEAVAYKSNSVSGSNYWMFEGELLDERRQRLEALQYNDKSGPEQ